MRLPWRKPTPEPRAIDATVYSYRVQVSLVVTISNPDPMIADLEEVYVRSAVTDNLGGARGLLRTYAELVGGSAR